jgi:hypothetical protein
LITSVTAGPALIGVMRISGCASARHPEQLVGERLPDVPHADEVQLHLHPLEALEAVRHALDLRARDEALTLVPRQAQRDHRRVEAVHPGVGVVARQPSR